MAVFAFSSVTGAFFGASAPIVALLLLQPAEYGLFSIPYLIFAFGVSLQYSIVSEVWARSRGRAAPVTTWAEYSSSLAMLAIVVGLAAGATTFALVRAPGSALLFACAVLFAVYQSGMRYFRVATGAWRRVIVSDVVGIAGFLVGIFALQGLPELDWLAGAWLAAALSSVVGLGLPRFARDAGLVPWVRRNHRVIRPLLLDSLLMDAGAIGTPFLLAGFMGAHDFGVYRAVANVAMPVRLLSEPLRPVVGRMSPRRLFSARVTIGLIGLGVALSAACFAALVWVLPLLPFQLGTLMALIPFALPTSLFVAGNLWSTIYYWFCRMSASHRQIIVGRVSQTTLVVTLPILGFLLADLGGAIWGFAISCLLAAAVWMVLARLSPHDDRVERPESE